MERQKSFGLRLLEHSVADIRIYHEYLAHLALFEHLQQNGAYLPRALHSRILRGVEEAALHRYVVVREVLSAVFSDHEQLGVRVFLKELLSLADNVLVVHSGKALVCGDYQAGVGAGQRVHAVLRVEILALHFLCGTEDTLYLALYRLEIGAGMVKLGFRLAHFRGGYQIHRVGYLLSIPDALDTVLNLFCVSHSAPP